MAAKFINFCEATVIHGNALFTAAVVSRSIRHAQAHNLPYQKGNIYVQKLPMKHQTTTDEVLIHGSCRHGKMGSKALSPLVALAGCVLFPVNSPKPSHSAMAQLHATNSKI